MQFQKALQRKEPTDQHKMASSRLKPIAITEPNEKVLQPLLRCISDEPHILHCITIYGSTIQEQELYLSHAKNVAHPH